MFGRHGILSGWQNKFDFLCLNSLTYFDVLSQEIFGGELIKRPVKGSKMENERNKDYLMHCVLQIDGKPIIMASDEMNPKAADEVRTYEHPAVTININFNDEADIDRAYEKLSANAQCIKVPLCKQFWGAKFGMLIDKYGIPWMMNCEMPPAEKKEDDKSCKEEGTAEKKARTE